MRIRLSFAGGLCYDRVHGDEGWVWMEVVVGAGRGPRLSGQPQRGDYKIKRRCHGNADLKMRLLMCVDCQRFKAPVSETKATNSGRRRASER